MVKLHVLAVASCLASLCPQDVFAIPSAHRAINTVRGLHGALHLRDTTSTNTKSPYILRTVTSNTWSGWHGVEKIFSFGDSWSDSGFNPTGSQPNDTYPLGNPFSNSSTPPYHTFTNGINWIEFLTFKYNASQVDTYNLAVSGSVVDATTLDKSNAFDLVRQISERFVPNYVSKNSTVWTGSNSLFSLFFGINDVNRSWEKRDSKIADAIFSSYLKQLNELHRLGARNFLIHTVPPIDRGPYVEEAERKVMAQDINDFNYRMTQLFAHFTGDKNDVSVLLFHTNNLFSEVMDNPSIFPQTAIYKDTKDACKAYEQGEVPRMDYFNSTCEYPVNEYLWLNGLHPTYPVHEAIAAQLAIALA